MNVRTYAIGALASIAFTAGAQADIIYFGTVITNACGTRVETAGLGLDQTSTGSASPGLTCSSVAMNAAAPGELKVGATSVVTGGADFGQTDTSAQAYFSVNDLIITGPGPTASGVIRLRVDGLLDASTDIAGSQLSASTSATWLLKINSTFGAGETRLAQSTFIISEEGDTNTSFASASFGVLDGYGGGTTVVELHFDDLATGTPLSFFLDLYGQTQAQAMGCASDPLCKSWMAESTGDLNFMSTVSFVRGTAAFMFDAPGFVANSDSLGIEDSYWNREVVAVPEPATAWLVALALLALHVPVEYGPERRGQCRNRWASGGNPTGGNGSPRALDVTRTPACSGSSAKVGVQIVKARSRRSAA